MEITGGSFAQSCFAQGVTTTITGATFSGDGTKKIFAGARLSKMCIRDSIFGSLTETISPAQQENALLQMDR